MDSNTITGLTGIFIMLVLILFFGMSPGLAMLLAGTVGCLVIVPPDSFAQLFTGVVGAEIWSIFSNYGLTVIPLFVLLGEVIYHAGYSNRLFKASEAWLGNCKGGLAMTTLLASAGFFQRFDQSLVILALQIDDALNIAPAVGVYHGFGQAVGIGKGHDHFDVFHFGGAADAAHGVHGHRQVAETAEIGWAHVKTPQDGLARGIFRHEGAAPGTELQQSFFLKHFQDRMNGAFG